MITMAVDGMSISVSEQMQQNYKTLLCNILTSIENAELALECFRFFHFIFKRQNYANSLQSEQDSAEEERKVLHLTKSLLVFHLEWLFKNVIENQSK